MQQLEKLKPGNFYHIYNRGNNREDIFFEEKNYPYFLELYAKHITPVADTFAYCLMRNHFHLLVRIKAFEEIKTSKVFKTFEVLPPGEEKLFNYSQPFSNFFNAYAKAINRQYFRTGSLFQARFGRNWIASQAILKHVIRYIHRNPQKHGFVTDFREYPHSSYHTLLADKNTRLKRRKVLEWFGGRAAFERFHIENGVGDDDEIQKIFGDDE